MSLEVTAWMSPYHAMNRNDERRKFSVATLRRILGFARPHRRDLLIFLLLSVVSAVLIVATPVLAGRVVDAIGRGAEWANLAGDRPPAVRAGRHHSARRGGACLPRIGRADAFLAGGCRM